MEKIHKTKAVYHIFTNNRDEYETDYNAAIEVFNEFVKEFGCARLYLENWANGYDEPISEDCLMSKGEYPL